MRYVVIVEEGEGSFGAHVPDLPGCVAVADTKEEVLELIQEAIEFHIEGLREDGQPVPPPSSSIEYVDVRAA
jgi:predicted RNase H-like HicB family nuclease